MNSEALWFERRLGGECVGPAGDGPHTGTVSVIARGFTLIEVMVALILLAVGLLGLAGLAGGAVRSLNLADYSSRAATIATRYMDQAVQEIHWLATPESCTNFQIPGTKDRVTRAVTMSATPRLTPHTVVVTVTPWAGGGTSRSYTVRTRVFEPLSPASAISPVDDCDRTTAPPA